MRPSAPYKPVIVVGVWGFAGIRAGGRYLEVCYDFDIVGRKTEDFKETPAICFRHVQSIA